MESGSGNQSSRATPARPPDGILGTYDNAFKLYEDGKHRRYELLFAVNGGAFAVAKLVSDADEAKFLGGLSLGDVAVGLAAFTVLMIVDMMVFGQRMRIAAGDGGRRRDKGIFSLWGKAVLALIGLLIVVGWLRVA